MSSRQPSSPATFLPAERATVPAAVEVSSDSAWAEFKALQARHAARFDPTQPGARPPARPEFAATQKQAADGSLPAAARQAPWTVDEAMQIARRHGRVCPKPPAWQQLYAMLPPRDPSRHPWHVPPPMDARGWAATGAVPKRLVLRQQLDWAHARGVLDAVCEFLERLPESDWHHAGE